MLVFSSNVSLIVSILDVTLGSVFKWTASATPSGSIVVLILNGNLELPNNTSIICPYAANVLVLVTFTKTRDFSVSVNWTSLPYTPL